jgi:UPF0755 protein
MKLLSQKFKIISIIAVVIITIAIGYGYKLYSDIFSPNTNFNNNEVNVYIPTDSGYEQAKEIIKPHIEDTDKFDLTASKSGYKNNVKSGRFIIKKGMSSYDIIRALRQNIPLQVAFNNQETIEKLVSRISTQVEPDSLSLITVFKDSTFLKENSLNEENLLSIFIPNTYEFFWNTTPVKFRDKMIKEYRNFWNEERLTKAKTLGLTPIEVIILASIVHKETVKNDERPRVAGVYLNRLQRGIKLDADPTVIYAVKKNAGDFDKVIKRVLFADLEVESPYNTYKYAGLPPGPIAMPDISAIDAVLNPEKHDYIYFCASVTNFGYHEFAKNVAQHEVNRKKYVKWINQQGIKR